MVKDEYISARNSIRKNMLISRVNFKIGNLSKAFLGFVPVPSNIRTFD